MTPDELNSLVAKIITALNGQPDLGRVSEGLPADNDGTLPEIYIEVSGVELCLTVSPL